MKKRTTPVLILSLFVLLGVCFFSLVYGSYEMNLARILETLIHGGTPSEHLAIWGIRIPRTLVAIFVGIALSVAGCIMQGVTQNPLAEPGLVGINAGATLAVVLYISASTSTYYSALGTGTLLLTPLISIVGGLLASLLIYFLARTKKGVGKTRLLLVGVGMNIAISSLITLFQLSMSKGKFNQALSWTNGSLWGSGLLYFIMIAPATTLLFLYILYKSKVLDVLNLGDAMAIGLGLDVNKERKKFLLLAVLLSSLAVAVAGNISFVGLIGPHMANQLVGSSHIRKIPVAAIISACLVVLADTLSRNLFSPIEIPVGIVISLIGVPYFIYLMMK